MPRILAILMLFVLVLLVIAGIIYFFGTQFYHLFQNLQDFGSNIESTITTIEEYIEEEVFMGKFKIGEVFKSDAKDFIGTSNIIGKTISSSTTFFGAILISLIYTFLFLLYRGSFKQFILIHFQEDQKTKGEEIVKKIKKVSQSYFFGLLLIILILGTLNGTALLLIGLDYPYLFGFFAAFLAIIPYIGTFIGGLLPTLYALINYDNIWTPILVIALYVTVQALEGNILTPKIVGSQVSLNPLFALIALFVGGLMWGIAGMILFIPLVAVLKVILDNMDGFRPYGMLLSSEFGDHNVEFTGFRKTSKTNNEEVD
jgi:predicted PurR-regulated permease PerM